MRKYMQRLDTAPVTNRRQREDKKKRKKNDEFIAHR